MKSRRFLLAGAIALVLTGSIASAQTPALTNVPLNGATTLEIDVQSGDLTLLPDATQKNIQVETDRTGSLALVHVAVEHAGSLVTVAIKGGEAPILPLSGGHSFEVRYPAALALKIRQYHGSVTLANSRAPVEIYSEMGGIFVSDSYSSVAAEAESGDIRVRGARASVEVVADSGNVDAQLAPSWSGRLVRLEAGHGNLQLAVPQGFRARFDVNAESGTASNALPSSTHSPLVFMLTEHGNAEINVISP